LSPGTQIGASGTEIGASGTEIGASGTEIGASGTQFGTSGTEIGASGTQSEASRMNKSLTLFQVKTLGLILDFSRFLIPIAIGRKLTLHPLNCSPV
jgi:hypothetical protein